MNAMNGKKKPTNYDTDNDGIDTEGEGSHPSKMSSAEKRKRRMSYQPPRRNSMAGNKSSKPPQQNAQAYSKSTTNNNINDPYQKSSKTTPMNW